MIVKDNYDPATFPDALKLEVVDENSAQVWFNANIGQLFKQIDRCKGQDKQIVEILLYFKNYGTDQQYWQAVTQAQEVSR